MDKNKKYVGYFVVKSGNIKIFEELLKYIDKLFLKKVIFDNVNVLCIVCKYVRFDMCIEFEKLDIFDDLVFEFIEKGWNVVLFLIERVGDELKWIEILKFFDKYGLDVYYVLRVGKIILYNVCVN